MDLDPLLYPNYLLQQFISCNNLALYLLLLLLTMAMNL